MSLSAALKKYEDAITSGHPVVCTPESFAEDQAEIAKARRVLVAAIKAEIASAVREHFKESRKS